MTARPIFVAALGIAVFALAGHYGIGWMALGTLLVGLADCVNPEPKS